MRISVIGAGVSGVGLALLANALGARVFVSEAKGMLESVIDQFKRHGVEWEERGHTPNLYEADLILVGSGISPRSQPVLEGLRRGVEVMGELDFVAPYLRGRMIGVTGSNGKSTVTALAGHLLTRAGFSVEVTGNIGRSIADSALKDSEFIVAELSSFQLHWNMRFACDLAVVTNIAPDHIDWHGSFEEYARAKARIIQTGKAGGYALVQESDRALLLEGDHSDRDVYAFSWSEGAPPSPRSISADEGSRRVLINGQGGDPETLFSFDDVPLMGRHNIENAAFAAAAVRLLAGKESYGSTLFSGFRGLPHRCEHVATVRGVRYVDDSKGTNVAASSTALSSLPGPKVVILGGQGKGEEYGQLAEAVKKEAVAAVVMGAEREKIVAALQEAGFEDFYRVASMEEAVATASRIAPSKGLVLLSPACTSWDMYPDYQARGDHFKSLVLEMKGEGER
ncbi:MAG: UDP-N-acetylmuramoyl-L-alanine--D-glutamate ligase [Synergistaceae bacterium]|nr:UDP-N-acetylmuramoyl-L-alanine--D-glutamate ligase [Synergistaceae bacterium]